MPRKMSERAAWAYLAKCWDGPLKKDGDAVFLDRKDFGYCYGLCGVIDCLYGYKKIDADVYETMSLLVRLLSKHFVQGAYAWPITAYGARQRAAFCRRQVARLDRAKKKPTKGAK